MRILVRHMDSFKAVKVPYFSEANTGNHSPLCHFTTHYSLCSFHHRLYNIELLSLHITW